MIRRIGGVCAVLLAAAALSCRGNEGEVTAENIEEVVAENVAAATGGEASTDTAPCEILDDALIRAHFDVAPEVEISRSLSKYSNDPLCTVTWAKPNAAEIESERAAAMSDYMMRKMKGEKVEMPSFRTENEVSLTIHQRAFETPEQARTSFDNSMKTLREGITVSHEETETTFQQDMTAVAGVGDAAFWVPGLSQLSVVNDRRIFHVGVNTGVEPVDERETAVALARQIAERL